MPRPRVSGVGYELGCGTRSPHDPREHISTQLPVVFPFNEIGHTRHAWSSRERHVHDLPGTYRPARSSAPGSHDCRSTYGEAGTSSLLAAPVSADAWDR